MALLMLVGAFCMIAGFIAGGVLGFLCGPTVGISAMEIKTTLYPSNAMLHNDPIQEARLREGRNAIQG